MIRHGNVAPHETPGGKWFVTCDCGYRSTNRTSYALAVDAGVHHLHKVAKLARENGWS